MGSSFAMLSPMLDYSIGLQNLYSGLNARKAAESLLMPAVDSQIADSWPAREQLREHHLLDPHNRLHV